MTGLTNFAASAKKGPSYARSFIFKLQLLHLHSSVSLTPRPILSSLIWLPAVHPHEVIQPFDVKLFGIASHE